MAEAMPSIVFVCTDAGGVVTCRSPTGREVHVEAHGADLPLGTWLVSAIFNADAMKELGVKYKPGQELVLMKGDQTIAKETIVKESNSNNLRIEVATKTYRKSGNPIDVDSADYAMRKRKLELYDNRAGKKRTLIGSNFKKIQKLEQGQKAIKADTEALLLQGAGVKADTTQILADGKSHKDELLAELKKLNAHQEGKAEKQSKAAEAKRQQNDSLLARVDAGDATDLETLQVQQKKTQLLIRVAKEKMKQNKASGLKCAACGSLEGEMKPYIGSGFLGNCCAELRMTEEELQHDLQNCLAQNFLEPAEADGILGFCKDKLPESKRIILPRFKVASLQSSKIMCADVDENDEHPQYEFANMDEHNYGMRQSSITGTALQPLCQKIAAVYFAGAEQRFHIVINCHADGKAYTPSHRDQPMSLQSKSSVFETHASVYVFSVGASRLFSFFKDLGQKGNTGLKARGNLEVLYDIKTAHNTLAHMSGKVNAACLHAVWPDPSTNAGDDTLRFGVTVRVAERLFVNTLRGEYRIYKHGAWETKKLPALSDDVPAQAPEQDGVAPVPENDRKRQFESMSKAQLVKVCCEAGVQPAVPQSSSRSGKRAQGEQHGPAEKGRLEDVDAPTAPDGDAFQQIPPKKLRAQKRQALPPPPPAPEDVRLVRALSVKCPKLGLAMLDGTKVAENRTYELPLGWHWLYISKGRDLKGLEGFKSLIDGLQYSTEEQEKCYCKVIGGIYIAEIRTPEDCNAYPWAKGPHCHIISHTLTLTEPVPIQKPGPISVRWEIKNEAERQRIEAQLPEGAPTAMDLTPLQQRLPGAAAPSAAAELADGDRGARRAARRTARRSARRADETRVLVHAFDFESTVDIPLTTDAFYVPANVGTVGDVLTLWRQKYSEWPEVEIEWDGKIVESTSDVLTVWRQKYRAPPEVKIEFDGEIVESAMSLASLAQGSPMKQLYKVAVMRLVDDEAPLSRTTTPIHVLLSFVPRHYSHAAEKQQLIETIIKHEFGPCSEPLPSLFDV